MHIYSNSNGTNTNSRINHLQQSALRLVYDNYVLILGELLEKNGSFTIHHYNIQTSCTEFHKLYHNLSQTTFSEFFTRNSSTYNMRSKSDFVIPLVGKVFKGSSSICYYGQIIWSLVPEEIRSTNSLESFKIKITGKSMDCPSRICKNYIRKLGFLETFE